MSPATSLMSRPATSMPMSIFRDTDSCWMTGGLDVMFTSATSPRRTCSPPGPSMSRDSTSSTLRRTSGVPQTTTSKIF